jgi:hypothetical protein
MDITWMILIVIACGAAGGFVNVFIGDSGLHLPRIQNGILEPGFLGTALVGGIAALGSWGAAKSFAIMGPTTGAVGFSTGDIANALMIGFGGAKWFKSEAEKDVLQKTAAIAASKSPDPKAAAEIGSSSPIQALAIAMNMHD